MPGRFRDAYPADDGDHSIVRYEGVDLLSDPRPETTMVTFSRRGSVIRSAQLFGVIEDRSRLDLAGALPRPLALVATAAP